MVDVVAVEVQFLKSLGNVLYLRDVVEGQIQDLDACEFGRCGADVIYSQPLQVELLEEVEDVFFNTQIWD